MDAKVSLALAHRQLAVQVKIKASAVESMYQVHNACGWCGESMSDVTPFQLDGVLYCSPHCLRQVTNADDESVKRRAAAAEKDGRDNVCRPRTTFLKNYFEVLFLTKSYDDRSSLGTVYNCVI